MPIVTQSVLDRKRYCPTVYETFGVFIDAVIARCDTKTYDKDFISHNGSCYRQCAAEFCYTWDPTQSADLENVFVTRVPFSKTINLELFNEDTGEIVNFKSVEYGDVARCKFCHNTIATVLDNRMLELDSFERYRPWSDKQDLLTSNNMQPNRMKIILRDEKFRSSSIPYMVAKYKRENGIPETVCTNKK